MNFYNFINDCINELTLNLFENDPEINFYDFYDFYTYDIEEVNINQSILDNISIIRQNVITQRNLIQNPIEIIPNIRFSLFFDNLDNFDDLQDVKVTLSQDELNKLETIILDKTNLSKYNTCNCSICLEEFNLNNKIINLKCKHFFHYNCIYNWLSKESTKCPTCRQDQKN
jgi:hypothetical protein